MLTVEERISLASRRFKAQMICSSDNPFACTLSTFGQGQAHSPWTYFRGASESDAC